MVQSETEYKHKVNFTVSVLLAKDKYTNRKLKKIIIAYPYYLLAADSITFSWKRDKNTAQSIKHYFLSGDITDNDCQNITFKNQFPG